MLLHDFLINSARNYPEKAALVTGRGSWTYGQLDRATDSFAGALLEGGFRKGDRLGIHAGNCMEAVVGIFGALKAGGAFVLINPAMKKNKIIYILSDAGCTALLTSAQRLEGDPLELLDAVPSLAQVYLKDAAEEAGRLKSFAGAVMCTGVFNPPAIVDVDLAALIYTSGSTGFPKGVAVTHLNMVAAARSISIYLDNGPDDVVLNVLPLSFDYGLYQVLMMFMAGGKIVLEEPSIYPTDIVRTIREHRVTGLPCVSTIFSLFTRLTPAQCNQIDTLRYITNTGSALNINYTKKIREMFPAVRLFSMYGLTECKRVSYLPPEEIDRRPGSVGKAMPNVEVYIVKDDGTAVAPGETGELVVRGSNVMQGYWEDHEATSRVLKQGKFPWEKVLYTGDLFRTDEEGFLYFVARKDDIIKTRGEKVSPKEVENVIIGLGEVREVVVVGVPDDVLGFAIHAHVVLAEKGALSEEAIRAHCAKNLEPSCIPKAILFHEEIPRNSSGKVDKSRLNAR
jgi:long-chain acyl-CoA synthetase